MASQKTRPDHLELVGSAQKAPRLPKLLLHLQQQSLDSVKRLLDQMFSASDDLFYDLSKRASSNNEQNLYFESMREIRVKKLGLTSHLAQSLESGFQALLSDQEPAPEKDEQNPSQLSIVESDKLEVELALTNMTGRARDTYKEALYELTFRIDHLLHHTSVSEDSNPLDPQYLCTAFIDACAELLQVNIKARLILFKLFEKNVLKQLGHLYSDANQVLIDAGIVPKVPKYLGKNPDGTKRTEPVPEAPPPQAAESAPQMFQAFSLDANLLSSVMEVARSQQSSLFRSPNSKNESGTQAYYLFASNPGPTMEAAELANLLTKTQPIIDRQLTSSEQPKNIVSDIILQLLSKGDANNPQSVNQLNEDIINLIAMFFDTVLDDSQLPPVVQSLVCRLQIPLLKVALRDNSFLEDPEHPAKKLVNIITEAGFGVDDSKPLERDPIYRKIADGVQTINRQYKSNDDVFLEVYNEIKEQLEKEKRKTNIVEQRTNQAEEGKSKIKHARATAQKALYTRLKDTRLPEPISSFLTNTWLQVLVITHLKFGKESTEWVEVENVTIDLIWLCQAHDDERSILRKQRLMPEVLERIETGLEAAIDNPESRASKVKAVEEALSELSEPEENQEEFVELSDDQRETLGKSEPQQKSWDEMTALERQQTRYEELSNQFYMEARDLPIGVWLDYTNEETSRKTRCKLSAKIDAETYIFVNRIGLKTLEKTRRQFAYDMQFNRAVILDSAPVFERLMQKVINHLKSVT